MYMVTAGVLARLDELDASKTATKHMPCLGKSPSYIYMTFLFDEISAI
jgi:hypothetical protein